MITAKQDILDRIRAAVALADPPDRASDYAAIPCDYQHAGTLSAPQCIKLFRDRLQDYGCDVILSAATEIAATVGQTLTHRSKKTLLVAPAFNREWLPEGFEFIIDNGLPNREIEAADGVITGCALAIASTGTIILRHSAAEGRRALSLLPDYQLCIVFESQVVETVPEGIAQMRKFATTPITTISGPSATSDIEMTRIKGVHGPRVLDVVLVSSP